VCKDGGNSANTYTPQKNLSKLRQPKQSTPKPYSGIPKKGIIEIAVKQ
jgi:hypothetical protein